MASRTVTCQLTTPKKVNFARLSRLVIDLFARIMRDILLFHYQSADDLQQKLRESNLKMDQKLKIDRDKICDGYEKCDVTLLYTLIRYTCNINPPTVTERRKMGWGGDRIPSRECTTLGNDMERFRIIRNRVCGHINSTEIEDNDLEKYFDISFDVCQRLDGMFGTKEYAKELETIRDCRMEEDLLVHLTEKVKEDIEMNKEIRRFLKEETG